MMLWLSVEKQSRAPNPWVREGVCQQGGKKQPTVFLLASWDRDPLCETELQLNGMEQKAKCASKCASVHPSQGQEP